jgi:hypothetical protein
VTNIFTLGFAGTSVVDIPKIIRDQVYCAFRYTLPNGGMRPFLEFVHVHQGHHPARPLVSLTIKKKLTNGFVEKTVDGGGDARVVHEFKGAPGELQILSDVGAATQFRMPTMPFIRWVLEKGAQKAKEHLKEERNGGAEDVLPRSHAIDFEEDTMHEDLKRSHAIDFDEDTMHEATEAINEWFGEQARKLDDEQNHAMGALVQSAANLVFDLDNDLRSAFRGGWKLVRSRDLEIAVEEFYIKGKVTECKIPISLFVESIESLDGARDQLRVASRMQEEAATTTEAIAKSVAMTGNITIAELQDLVVEGNFRSLVKPKYRAELVNKITGSAEASDLKTWLNVFINYLLERESDFLWHTRVPKHLQVLHREDEVGHGGETSPDVVDEISIDKTAIQAAGHFHYKGDFHVNKMMLAVVTATNNAADLVATAKARAKAQEICVAGVERDYEEQIKASETVLEGEQAKC